MKDKYFYYFSYEYINFYTCTYDEIENFSYKVNNGVIGRIAINEIFDKIKSREFTEEEAVTIISNIIIASTIVMDERIEYQTLSYEVLIYLVKFIDIPSASVDLKIAFALFTTIVDFRKYKETKQYSYKNIKGVKEKYYEFLG
eukprot:jgi/Orpsp1_1/1181030/evm.model.c7180000075570.1